MKNTSKKKLLVIGDSPTVTTGFGGVVRNLCKEWHASGEFERIDIWAINYNGWPHEYPYRIFPAGYGNWTSDTKLIECLNLIGSSDYTDLFVLADCHMLSSGQVPKVFREMCDKKKVKLTFYYPVDSPLIRDWLAFAKASDNVVTYTEYGRRETNRADATLNPNVIPHGVDLGVYRPLENRDSLREKNFSGWVKPDDYLIINVNRNEKRKAPHHSLQILKALKANHVHNVKLLLHMPRHASMNESVDLEAVGNQLGLEHGDLWRHSDSLFVQGNGLVSEDGLNQIYNCADLVLSTSLGEGWGLSITEGAAAGCRVAAPWHTSIQCIAAEFQKRGQEGQIHLLPTSPSGVANPWDLSRIRFPVDVDRAAKEIAALIDTPISGENTLNGRFILNDDVREWLSWERIAGEFLKLMNK